RRLEGLKKEAEGGPRRCRLDPKLFPRRCSPFACRCPRRWRRDSNSQIRNPHGLKGDWATTPLSADFSCCTSCCPPEFRNDPCCRPVEKCDGRHRSRPAQNPSAGSQRTCWKRRSCFAGKKKSMRAHCLFRSYSHKSNCREAGRRFECNRGFEN